MTRVCQEKGRAIGARVGPLAVDRFPQLQLKEGQLNDMPQCEESVDWGLKTPRYRLPESTRQAGESLIRPKLVRYEESLT